jgi:hypothetical protein
LPLSSSRTMCCLNSLVKILLIFPIRTPVKS